MTLENYNHYPPRDIAETVDKTVADLRKRSDEFDSIAVRGVSGIMVGAPVAYMLRKPLLVVRKPHEIETAHTGYLTSNFTEAGSRYIILDDFTASGTTVRAIKQALADDAPDAAYAGQYMYLNDDSPWTPA